MKQPKESYKPAEKLELKEVTKETAKVFKKIHCPSCEGEVNADNLNLQNSVAKCSNCNVIFSIKEELDSLILDEEIKQEFLRPEGIDLFYFKEDLEITVQQHIQGLDLAGLILFPALAFFAILIYFVKSIPIYFPIGFTLASFYYIYRSMNYSKNKTYIDVNDQFLSIKARPKHFVNDKKYAANDIDQLYLKHAADGSGHYTVFMIINGIEGQKHEKLLTVNSLSKAKYLEQEIERYLNIEQRKVPEATV